MNAKLTLLVLALLPTACARIVVVPVTPNSLAKGTGVFYALPKTVIRIQMKVDKSTSNPAPYQKFAPIFVPGAAVACKDCLDGKKQETYSVQKNATLGVFGVPDPEHIYLVQFAGGGAIDQTIAMSWNEAGLASNAASSVTNKTIDVALAGAKAATGLAMKASGYGFTREVVKSERRRCPVGTKNDDWAIPVLMHESLGTQGALLVENWCDIDVKDREKFQPSDEEVLRRARDAYATRLRDLVDSHAKLLRGQTQSFEPLALASRLEVQIEQHLRSLFLGRKETITWELVLNVTPKEPGVTPVFNFDARKGVCPMDSLLAPESAAKPREIARPDDAACQTAVNLSIAYHPRASEQLFHAAKNYAPQVTGTASFRYVIPAQVSARLTSGETVHASALLTVAQLGHVAALPARRNSKGLSYELAFIEATGGLKSFKLAATGGIDAGAIDTASTLAGSALDARTREEAKGDELVLLKREADILEQKKKICEAQKALGETCRFAE